MSSVRLAVAATGTKAAVTELKLKRVGAAAESGRALLGLIIGTICTSLDAVGDARGAAEKAVRTEFWRCGLTGGDCCGLAGGD